MTCTHACVGVRSGHGRLRANSSQMVTPYAHMSHAHAWYGSRFAEISSGACHIRKEGLHRGVTNDETLHVPRAY